MNKATQIQIQIQIQIISLPINPKYNSTQYTTPKYIQESRTTHKNKSELKITKKKLYMIVFNIDWLIEEEPSK